MKLFHSKSFFYKQGAVDGKFVKKGTKESLFIFTYIKPYWRHFLMGLLFVVLTSAVSLIFPYMLKKLIDTSAASIKNPIDHRAISILWVILLLLFLQMIFSFLRVYFFTYTGEHALADLRKKLYGHIIRMPMAFFAQRRVGDLSSRLSSDLSQIQDGIVLILAESLRGIVTLIAGLVFILYINFKLTLLILSVLPLIIFVAKVFSKKIRGLAVKAQDNLSDSNIIVQETFMGIANVKVFTNEAYETGRYDSSLQKVIRTAIKNGKIRALFISFLNFLIYATIVVVVWYGVRLMQANELSFGDLTAFVIYTTFVGTSVSNFADLYSQLQKIFGSTERIKELFAMPVERTSSRQERMDNEYNLKGNVELANVSFSYSSRPDILVLNDINLKVSEGEKIAIVGPSGAGKTTLISLLLRFYDPVAGQILFDGRDARSIPISVLRRQIALVSQDVLLFGGSIRENIAYGRPGAEDSAIENAAKKANAHDFISSFPDGYDTVVGDRGVKLSGGQRQRIAIARALLKDTGILILDEATSALDSSSELVVQEALNNLFKGRTSFIIAHRLSTIKNADKIIVIDQGTVKESGTHIELLQEKDSLYKNLSELQSRIN